MSSVVSGFSLLGALSVTALTLAACAHGVSSSNGDGGSDGVSAPSATLSNATVGTTMGGACDTGVPGSILVGSTTAQQATCNACIMCTESGMCATEYNTLEAEPSTNDYLNCLQACADGDTTCSDGCSTSYPAADSDYLSFVSCGICQDCVQNCDAADTCTT